MQANILAYMFSIVESGKITLPLNPAVQGDTISNLVYIQQFVADLLKRAFGHLSEWVFVFFKYFVLISNLKLLLICLTDAYVCACYELNQISRNILMQ